MDGDLKVVNKPGVTVVVVNRGKILLLKRINLFFITNPGIWYFVAGGRKGNESDLENAYREIGEEIGLKREDLTVIVSFGAVVVDQKRKTMWDNMLFVMSSSTQAIKLNMEHSAYRWVEFDELKEYDGLLGSLRQGEAVLSKIKAALDMA